MPRIAYRIALPAAQFALYLLLVWFGCPYRPVWQRHGIGEYAWIDGPINQPEQLAAGLNIPAVVVATLALLPFGSLLHTGSSREAAAHIATALLIPVLWFFIGRRLDRGPSPDAPLTRIGKAIAIGMLSIGALTVLLIAVTFVIQFGEPLALRALILTWSIGTMLISWRSLRSQPRVD